MPTLSRESAQSLRTEAPVAKVPLIPADYGKWESLGMAVLSVDGKWVAVPRVAIHRYVPEGSRRKGASLHVRSLATGAMTVLGNVTEFAWQDKGRLLAFAIDAEGEEDNGVQLSDRQTGLLRLLYSGEATITSLGWREKDNDPACCRSRSDNDSEEDTYVVLAWRDFGSAGAAAATKAYYQAGDKTFPAWTRVVPFGRPPWARDGSVREKSNQIDYHRRILRWSGHHLKGKDAPARITKGMTVIGSERASKAL